MNIRFINQNVSNCIVAIFSAALLFIAIGLYSFSGSPKPWAKASQGAHNIASFQRYEFLSRLLHQAPQDADISQIKEILIKNGTSFSVDEGEYDGAGYFLSCSSSLYDIVIIGKTVDEIGMVWAITRDGVLLKIFNKVINNTEHLHEN